MIQTVIDTFKECSLDEYTTRENAEKFAKLCDMLIETNKKMNITAITDPRQVALRHFADSVKAASFIPKGVSVIDVGCGGGFPTLPLAIVRPDLDITALDSTAKKLTFVADAASALSLNVRTLAARAEEAGTDGSHREKYDICVSRAVARLNVLSELCLPLVKKGGAFIAMKGADAEIELAEAEASVRILGGRVTEKYAFALSDAGEREIIIIHKDTHTPAGYPRQFAKIRKAPLR